MRRLGENVSQLSGDCWAKKLDGGYLLCYNVRNGDVVMGKAIDLMGQRFGRLVVIEKTKERRGGCIVWKVKCDCGRITTAASYDLRCGDTTSCGCSKRADMVGKRFGRITVISYSHTAKNGSAYWNVLCDCGNRKVICGGNLRSGATKSCGCITKELMSAAKGPLSNFWNPKLTDKDRLDNRKYPEYYEWRKAVFKRDDFTCQRCGERGGKLNTHHIESYADNKKLRVELSNGITLCEACHKDFHDIYGRKHSTRTKFDKWLSSTSDLVDSKHL